MDLCSLSYEKNLLLDRSSATFDDLPNVLVADIFSRLPVKTVVQSTSVSKLWYSLIKNPSFISAHLSRSISDLPRYYSLVIRKSSPLVNVFSHNHVLTRHPNLNLPFIIEGQWYVVGTCNGLLCLRDIRHEIYLGNPFIHKYRKLGVESSCYPDLICKINRFGGGYIDEKFSYSEVDNDYKIFRLIVKYDPTGPRNEPRVLLKIVEIYSLNTGKWKKSMYALDDQIPIGCSPTLVNGCLYWLPETEDDPLICFNLKDQLISKINLPTAYVEASTRGFRILEKNGSVALCDLEFMFSCKRILMDKSSGKSSTMKVLKILKLRV